MTLVTLGYGGVLWPAFVEALAEAGATVLTCTCTGVVSGNASMGSSRNDQTPSAAMAAVRASMAKRCRSESAIS